MTTILITETAEEHYKDIEWALKTPGAKAALKEEFNKHISYLEDGTRLGRLLPAAGPTAREIVLRKGAILMRYDEPQAGIVEIFEFLFSRNNH